MHKDYLIQEKPLKALFLFALPMIIGNLFQQFYTMADSIVVGQYVSEDALAAVGASYSLTTVFISIAIGGGTGASVITSQCFGAKKYDRMKRSARTAIISFLILSAILAVFGMIFCRKIMLLLNTPENILEPSVEYLNIYFLGLPFLFMYNVLSAMFNALGKSRIPLFLLIFSSVFNIVLDIFMVKTLSLGIAGVAWATLIAQGLSAIIAFAVFIRQLKDFDDNADEASAKVWFDKELFGTMTMIALPSILQQSTVSIGMMLVQSVVNSFGSEMLAGFSAAMRIESICVVPMSSMGNAMASYTAQNIGAGKYERVKQGYHKAFGIIAGFALLICIVLELFHTPLIAMFLGNDGSESALRTGVGYLTFMGWFFIMIGIKMVTDGVLRGSGDMKMFTVANLSNLGLRVFVATVFAPLFGIHMVWIAVPIGWTVNFIISFCEYRTGKWKRVSRSS